MQLFGRKWKPLKRPEAVCLGCSGRFVGHCKLTARSYLGEYFLRLEYGADRYIWEQSSNRIQNHGGDVEIQGEQPEKGVMYEIKE